MQFRMSPNFGCDVFMKNLDENYFQYVPEGEDKAKEFYEVMLEGLIEIRDEPEVFDALSERHQEKLVKVIEGIETVWIPFEIEFSAALMKKHENLRGAIEGLFLDNSSVTMDYDKYFESCDISVCTYTYVGIASSAGVASILLGLVGGIISGSTVLFTALYGTIRYLVLAGDHADDNDKEVEFEDVSTKSKSSEVVVEVP